MGCSRGWVQAPAEPEIKVSFRAVPKLRPASLSDRKVPRDDAFFHYRPSGGQEKFQISNIRFEYSDYLITGGFNNTASHGGPIAENIQARICYFYSESEMENIIVRLEIAK